MKILFIEDDPNARLLLRRSLHAVFGSLPDINIRECPGITAGLAVLDDGYQPDIVLLDLGLEDSPSALHTADKIGEFKDAAVVVVTGNTSAVVMQRCFEMGADSYINKMELSEGKIYSIVYNAFMRRAYHDTCTYSKLDPKGGK